MGRISDKSYMNALNVLEDRQPLDEVEEGH